MEKDLKNIKVGDQVLVSDPFGKDNIEVVTRIGKSFIEINNNKYCNVWGTMKPYASRSRSIQRIATEQDKKDIALKIKNENIRYFFRDLTYSGLPSEIIQELDIVMTKIKGLK